MLSTGQVLQAEPLDIDGRIHIPVQIGPAAWADPGAVLQRQRIVDGAAHGAGLAGGIPAADLYHPGPVLDRGILQDLDELGKGQVGHLPAPQPLHPLHAEVFDAEDRVLFRQPVRQLEEPVPAGVGDLLIGAVQVFPGPLPVMAAILAPGEFSMCGTEIRQGSLEPLGRVDDPAVVQGQEVLQPEVHPGSLTCSRRDGADFLADDEEEDIELSQPVPFDSDSDGTDGVFNLSGLMEAEGVSHDADLVGPGRKLVAGLFQGEAGVLREFPEVGRGFPALPLFPDVLEE